MDIRITLMIIGSVLMGIGVLLILARKWIHKHFFEHNYGIWSGGIFSEWGAFAYGIGFLIFGAIVFFVAVLGFMGIIGFVRK